IENHAHPLIKQNLHYDIKVLLRGVSEARRDTSRPRPPPHLEREAGGDEPGIKVRRNSSARARGCHARKMAVMEQLGDPEAWRRRVGYGGR
ncbi:MAG: hypothetical protein NTY03_04260, partial [Candidatus Bathyarchaeota archaeon]|nr:hypothetical protein [Candidatus Bathyarchaeota archaeon]